MCAKGLVVIYISLPRVVLSWGNEALQNRVCRYVIFRFVFHGFWLEGIVAYKRDAHLAKSKNRYRRLVCIIVVYFYESCCFLLVRTVVEVKVQMIHDLLRNDFSPKILTLNCLILAHTAQKLLDVLITGSIYKKHTSLVFQ